MTKESRGIYKTKTDTIKNISDMHGLAQNDALSVTDAGSHVSFEKETQNHLLDDVSGHSGSVIAHGADAIDIDIIEDDDGSNRRIHLGFVAPNNIFVNYRTI
eukprot:1126716_1